MKYYVDTCIWIDFLDDRKGYNDEPLGLYAAEFFYKIIRDKDILIMSKVLLKEIAYFMDILDKFPSIVYVEDTDEQYMRAKILSRKYSIPINDAIHIIIAQDNNAILVTRDKHFKGLIDYKRPEES